MDHMTTCVWGGSLLQKIPQRILTHLISFMQFFISSCALLPLTLLFSEAVCCFQQQGSNKLCPQWPTKKFCMLCRFIFHLLCYFFCEVWFNVCNSLLVMFLCSQTLMSAVSTTEGVITCVETQLAALSAAARKVTSCWPTRELVKVGRLFGYFLSLIHYTKSCPENFLSLLKADLK